MLLSWFNTQLAPTKIHMKELKVVSVLKNRKKLQCCGFFLILRSNTEYEKAVLMGELTLSSI